jgi:hypothetical protein
MTYSKILDRAGPGYVIFLRVALPQSLASLESSVLAAKMEPLYLN